MSRKIESVAVIGSGTMGMGIAALCASAGCPVVLLDVSKELADKAKERMTTGRSPAIEDPKYLDLITTGNLDSDLRHIADCDWICEVVVENLDIKRQVFTQLESVRRDGSIITSNTSGIPLRDIYRDMPERLRKDIAVTHFFNPVKVMRLLELVPGEDTTPDVIEALADFCGNRLGKGVVYAKDTVNFIGNRIGCFWMLAGLHKGKIARENGLNIETLDALMSGPVRLPATGLYGLVDLIGLDVLDLVGKNLAENLPSGDAGRQFVALPAEEQAMLERGQLGRKTGGGYYRVSKLEDGSKLKEVYDLETGEWRQALTVELQPPHTEFTNLIFADDAEGRFAADVMLSTLCYAADLIPQISDDIVNVDRAMRWGFNWAHGPFEMLDTLDPSRVCDRLQAQNQPLPKMLQVLQQSGSDRFYRDQGQTFLGLDGEYQPLA